ncbi:MAG: response regulator, partial [Gammaproteobacteria bacterium]|nr:response regulator [Gammaproteobacteria bacterium]
NMRALVVDDDPINGKLLVYLLQARDVIADRVESGADALWQVDEQSYDLVFLDVHMPGLSGLDVVRELQQRQGSGPRSYPPLVATTADVQKGSHERLFAEGMDDFLAKPVDVTSLDEILRRWIPTEPAEKP